MSVSLLACRPDSRNWLSKRISEDSGSTYRWHKARAIVLSAMLDTDRLPFEETTGCAR